jgi:glycosyltransferase involved in cell wall biosynthesis
MIKVLHIDTELTWRGGENQILHLVSGSKQDAEHHIAVRPGSIAGKRFAGVCPVIPVEMRGGFAPVAAWKLAAYCRRHEIGVIDAHTSNAHSLGILIRGFYPQVKLVVHRRVDYAPGSDFINRKKYLSPKVDRYVAISRAIKNVLVTYGVPADRISVVRSAVDLTKYNQFDRTAEKNKLAATFSLSPELTFIGNASAFTEQKGYDTLITACKIMKDRGVPFHAFLAGDGHLMNQMEKLRADLGLEHDVTFLGFIEDVPRFLSSLDILAVSSRFEGLGTVILDGIGAGLAVVASDVGGIPEMIMHDKTGLLAPVGDAPAFAGGLAALIADRDRREKLQTAARRHIEEEFSVDAMIKGNLSVYRDLV